MAHPIKAQWTAIYPSFVSLCFPRLKRLERNTSANCLFRDKISNFLSKVTNPVV